MLSFDDARTFCTGQGGRLCRYDEVDSQCVKGDGCAFDSRLLWTSTPCETTTSTTTTTPMAFFHYLRKGADDTSACEEDDRDCSDKCVADTASHAVRCCSDTSIAGWERNGGCDRPWHESDSWGECQTLSFDDAFAFCRSQGGRLCRYDEVDSQCVKGDGCRFDRRLLWTSTPCETTTTTTKTWWLGELADYPFPDGFFEFAEDTCQPPLAQVKSEDKCAGRGYFVPPVTYQVSSGEYTTPEYCGKCDWPYYGRWCQQRRQGNRVDVVVVVDSQLNASLSGELANYTTDLAREGRIAEVFVWDLPVSQQAGAERELRRMLRADWHARGARFAFLVGHFPAVHCRYDILTLGYYMFFYENFTKNAEMCAKPGGKYLYPGDYYSRKEMHLAIGVLNHLSLAEYKFYFDKLRRWRAGGNRFFDVGMDTGNKPLLDYWDIGNEGIVRLEGGAFKYGSFSMGGAFRFPEDCDVYRTGWDGRCKASPPGHNCATMEGCNFTADGQAFWPTGSGAKPSVVESDAGTKFVLVRWKIHGAPSYTACFHIRDIRGEPFAGGSMFLMHSCSASKYTVDNIGAAVTSLKYGLHSLGTALNGAAQSPWLFAKFLQQGATVGEAFRGWWHGRPKGWDGFGQNSIVLYGDPTVIYGAIADWEARRTGSGEEEEESAMTAEEEREEEEFEREGERLDDEEADAQEEAADEQQFDAALDR